MSATEAQIGMEMLEIIHRHAVTAVEFVQMTDSSRRLALDFEDFLRAKANMIIGPSTADLSKEDLQRRKEAIESCLTHQRLPFQSTNEDIIVLGCIISPPYAAIACSCDNEAVLARIQQLISSIPIS